MITYASGQSLDLDSIQNSIANNSGSWGGGASGTGTGMAASGAISAIGSMIVSYIGAKSQKNTLETQAKIAEINARVSENAAQASLLNGQKQVAQSTLKYGAVKSSQKAALAANGVDIGTGNAAEIQASTDIFKEIDSATIHANAVREAWGYRTQSSNYQTDAMLKRSTAANTSAGMAAGSTLLSEGSKVSQQWYMLNKLGAFDNKPSNS